MTQPEQLKKNEPLQWSVGTSTEVWAMFCACVAGDLDSVKQLLKKNPALVRCQHGYRKPLYFAVRENRLEVAAFLLEANPSGGAGTGLNAFHWATNWGQLEIVKLVIRPNAPLEIRNSYGGTVLGGTIWAAVQETRATHPEIVEALLEAGANVCEAEYPSGNPQIDTILKRDGAKA